MPDIRLSVPLRLGVAGLAAAAAVAAAAPAHADTTPIGVISVGAQDLTIGASGPGADLPVSFSIFPESIATTTYTNAVLSIDTSGIAGVAAASTTDSRCSTSGTTIDCALGSLTATDFSSATADVTLHLKAVSGAAAGQSGRLAMTGSADGIAPTTSFQPTTITLADGPDLVAPPISQGFVDVTLGSTITTPHVALHNVGSQAAQGVTLVYRTPYEFPFIHLARNCAYASNPGTNGSLTVASCYFDNVIAVDQTYTLKRSQQVAVRTDSVYNFGSYVSVQAYPGYQPPSAAAPDVTWVRGTEQQLKLVKTGSGPSGHTPAHVTQTNINQFDGNSAQSYRVTDGVSSDLAALGDTVTAAGGSTVPVTIGVRDNGPGSLDFGPAGLPAAQITFTPPPGTTVTSAPNGCFLNFNSPTYLCQSTYLFLRDTTQTFTFQLQVPVGGATGAGSVSVSHGTEGPPPTGPDVYDTTWDNDVAPVTINP